MNTSDPWLSVILCTYQGERFLPAALESVAAQDAHDDIEIIAVDDGSSDGTMQILTSYRDSLPLRIIPTSHTGNWVENTNRGLHEARGTFCCLLHQDDLWAPERLATWRRLSGENPTAGFLTSSALYVDEQGRRVGRWTPPFPSRGRSLDSRTVLKRLLVQNNLALPAPLFKRALLEQVGDMDSSLWFLADWKFWAKLIAQGPVLYHPKPLVSFRLHGGSQTETRSQQASQLRGQYLDVIESIMDLLAQRTPEIRFAYQAAHINMVVSIALASMSHGEGPQLRSVASAILGSHPKAWVCFLRNSCIAQRVGARLRVRRRHSRRKPK